MLYCISQTKILGLGDSMKSIIKIILILFIGLILGICIDGFMHYKIQIPGEQFGSIAD